jgi:hypothetical protein
MDLYTKLILVYKSTHVRNFGFWVFLSIKKFLVLLFIVCELKLIANLIKKNFFLIF